MGTAPNWSCNSICKITQIYENAGNFAKIHEKYRKFPQIPARPRNCRRRRASHCVSLTYIAGYIGVREVIPHAVAVVSFIPEPAATVAPLATPSPLAPG